MYFTSINTNACISNKLQIYANSHPKTEMHYVICEMQVTKQKTKHVLSFTSCLSTILSVKLGGGGNLH